MCCLFAILRPGSWGMYAVFSGCCSVSGRPLRGAAALGMNSEPPTLCLHQYLDIYIHVCIMSMSVLQQGTHRPTPILEGDEHCLSGRRLKSLSPARKKATPIWPQRRPGSGHILWNPRVQPVKGKAWNPCSRSQKVGI